MFHPPFTCFFLCVTQVVRIFRSLAGGGGASCQDGWIRMAGKAAWNILCCILGIPDFFFVHLCALFVSCLPRILFVVLILVKWCVEHLGEVFDLKLWRKSIAPSQYRHHLLKECNAHATTTRCTCQVKTIHLKPGLLSLQWLRLRKDFTKHKENGGKTPRMGATKNHQRYIHLL